jgi:DNA polymerase III delta subunit
VAARTNKETKGVSPKQFLESHQSPGPILLLGADKLRVSELGQAIFKGWGADTTNPESVKPLAAKSLPNKPDALSDLFCAISLFSSSSFFHIRNGEELSSISSKNLATVLGSLPPAVGVVITGEKISGNNSLKKLAAKKGWLLELQELETSELSRWASHTLNKRGVPVVENVALHTLLEITEPTIDALAKNIEHLALYLNASPESPYPKKLSKNTILKVFVEHPDPNEYALLDTALFGNPAQIECQVRALIAAGKSEFLLLGLISRAISQYTQVHNLRRQGKSDEQIKASLKLPPSIAAKVMKSALRISPEKLAQTQSNIVRTDSLFKNRSLGGEILLDNLCHAMAR